MLLSRFSRQLARPRKFNPRFSWLERRILSTSTRNYSTVPLYCTNISPAIRRALSAMGTLPPDHGGSSLRADPQHSGISNTRTYNIHDNSYSNVGNVSNSYITNKAGVDEESLRIHAWLSPLEPDIRHRAVSNHRLDGIGDWVLQSDEFKSWRRGRDGSGDSTLLCYGGQGVGKTFIRYHTILRKRAIGNTEKE